MIRNARYISSGDAFCITQKNKSGDFANNYAADVRI